MFDGLPQVSQVVERYAAGAAAELEEARRLAGTVVEPRIVLLARLRIAMLLGNRQVPADLSAACLEAGLAEEVIGSISMWPSSPLFSDAERACLALAEQFVVDVSGVSDGDVAPVLAALGPAGLYGFVQALWVFDMSQRLELALSGALRSV